MNAICSFRKCTLSDEELVAKVDAHTDKMYQSNIIPDRHIPARPNDDYDLLVGELVLRFVEQSEKPVEVEPKTVFIIQDKENYRIYGCFTTRKDAEKYSGGSNNLAILELEVATY